MRQKLADVQPSQSLKTKVLEDGQCFLVSAQMKCAKLRLYSLFNWLKTLSRPPDVIAIQDPPLQLAFSSLPSYQTWFRGDDGNGGCVRIGEEDHPGHHAYIPPYPKAHEKLATKQNFNTQLEGCKKLAKVAFLVHSSIQEWKVSEPTNGPNRGLVATLHITIDRGALAIHNFYNHNHPNGRLDIAKLLEPCGNKQDAHIVVGDSNLQHPLWSRHVEGQNVHKKAKDLVAAMEAKTWFARTMAPLPTPAATAATVTIHPQSTSSWQVGFWMTNPRMKFSMSAGTKVTMLSHH